MSSDLRAGGRAGDIYVLDVDGLPRRSSALSVHDWGFLEELARARLEGVTFESVRLIGLEPANLEPGVGLSDNVSSVLDRAAEIVRLEVELLRGGQVQ